MLKRISAVGLVGVVGLALAACGSSSSREGFDDATGAPADPGAGAATDPGPMGGQQAGENPQADECTKMDLVFLVDDSGSMQEEQNNLAANFPKVVSILDQFKTKGGSKLDWRAAVTTTGRDVAYTISAMGMTIPQNEKGDNGAFRSKSSCGTSKPWVEKVDSNATSAFSCLAKVGTSGPSLEMPLYAMKLALVDRVSDGKNAGFLRPDALLAVIILTDEDDCSREDNNFTIANDQCGDGANVKPVADYAAVLDSVAGGPGRWAAAVIAGDKACKSSFGDAAEAKRLKDFVSLAGKNGKFSSICAGDLTTALTDALATFDGACRTYPGPR